MKTIPLTRGKHAIVDDEDYEAVARYRWFAFQNSDSDRFYAARGNRGGRKPHQLFMHREILGAKTGQQVDHVNSDTLDNRRANIRLCSGSQNICNARKMRGTSSRFKGVCFDGRNGKWIAQVGTRTERQYLGLFVDEISAARAYDEAARRLFGAFARCNFPTHEEEAARKEAP